MVAISSILFMITPIISLLILVLNLSFVKKNRLIIFILIALTLAIIAFYFNPRVEYDLYRYHYKMNILRQFNFNELIHFFIQNEEVEPVKILLMFIISKFSIDNNYLQLIMTFIGYSIIFYIINDYAKRVKVKNLVVLLSFIYLFFSLYYVDFISGLWNYIAIIFFALGIYLEYISKKNKKICYIIYIFAVMTHISMAFPLLLKCFFSFVLKDKIKVSSILLIVIFSLVFIIMVNFLPLINTENYVINTLNTMYKEYFNSNNYDYLFDGKYFVLTLIQFTIYLFIYCNKKNKEPIDNLTFLFLISFLFLFLNAGVFSRFILLIQLTGIPLLENYLNNDNEKKISKLFLLCFVLFTLLLSIFRINNFINLQLDFSGLFTEKIDSNLFYLIESR